MLLSLLQRTLDSGALLISLALLCTTTVQFFRERKEDDGAASFLKLLAIMGLCTLLLPMFGYIIGVFGGVYRHQDTVFKFGIQSWLLLGTAAACGATLWWGQLPRRWKIVLPLLYLPIPLLCSWCVLWTRTVRDAPRDSGGNYILSLNGARYLAPADRDAVSWLNGQAVPGDVVLEAVYANPDGSPGGDYTEFGRVSSLTGIPTPLGWCGLSHVPSWGADPVELRRRMQLVQQVYSWPDDETGKRALAQLGVRYVFVGNLEWKTYDVPALQRLRRALPVAFSENSAFIAVVPRD